MNIPVVRNPTPAVVIICAALLFVSAVYFLIPRYSSADRAFNKPFWSYELAVKGGAAAYKEYVALNARAPEDVQHATAHAMGSALFEQMGDAGISQCDASFDYGCYHGFFLSAIAAEGESRIRALYDACVATYGAHGFGCEHGLGHGILEFVGHDKLAEALHTCATLPRPDPVGGCTSGVFMEYNIPLQTNAAGFVATIPRAFDAMNPEGPCPTVSGEFKLSCYHELPDWWVTVFNHDYGKVGALCGAVSDAQDREECFEGLGLTVVSFANFDVSKIALICDTMPTANGAGFCREGAAWTVQDAPDTAGARLLCEPLDPSIRVFCPSV